MLKNKLNAHGGFTPAVLCSPEMRYNLNGYYVIITIRAGAV